MERTGGAEFVGFFGRLEKEFIFYFKKILSFKIREFEPQYSHKI